MPEYAVLANATSPELDAFTELLASAGVLRSDAVLEPVEKGALVTFTDGVPTVADSPFAERITAFWIVELGSLDEVISWMRRAPFTEGEAEIRRLYSEAELLAEIEAVA